MRTMRLQQLLPAAYLGGAGTSTSNDAFKTADSNYSQGRRGIFLDANLHCLQRHHLRNRASPDPGVRRNSLNGPGYKDVDLTLAKAFGLPKMPVLGENAKFEFRMDAYNVFNNLNFDPTSISNNIGNPNFGHDTAALGARTVTLGARFSF